ncbi:metallophosphoesterase [Nannocystis sp. RBIL2]|uniref:metallophosphoesterase n=1 Tax=Nannocystis sp. RBIL2 TaxID=2996788 RepID=UPI002271F32E|nr:metallophosphoesterase [Nannocystis sp. RBIL2]MCY1072820.1 metallophosphoesterase [Nannocystis sp. RBIL2]
MLAGLRLTSIVLVALVAACGDNAPALVPSTASTTGGSTASSTEGSTPTSTSKPDDGTTAPDLPVTTTAASTGDEPGTTGDGPGTTGDEPGTTSGETGTTGETDTADEPLLPGCGDTPPVDFHAEPSAPADGAAVPGPSVDLEVTIGGTILADATAKFHLREVHTLTDADDFTIVILPDTQNYTQFPGNFPQYPAQTQWVWDHRNTDNIVAVLHNGDVVQHGNIEEIEWERAETAMSTLEKTGTKFPDGIPYGIAVGNHDNGASFHDDVPNSTTLFNKYFGVKRFEDRAYYGGHYGNKNDNNWILVRAGNLDIVMVSLEYRGDLGQNPDVLAWARGVFEDHPHALGIVNSHHIVKANGDFSAEGKQIYDVMKKVDNVQLMTSGHIKQFRARRTDNYMGHKIHSMLADYQDLILPGEGCAGGCGYMRIWRFSPKKNQVKVETYSPSLDKSMTSDKEQFTLTLDLSAATGVFEVVGQVAGPGAALAHTVSDLKSGATYEWYAIVKECGAKVTTPTRTFTVE